MLSVSGPNFICCYTKSQIKSLSTSSKPQRVWINTGVVGRNLGLKAIYTNRERKTQWWNTSLTLIWSKIIRVCGLVHLFSGYTGLLNGCQGKLQFTDSSAHIKICWDFLRSGRGEVFRAGCSHTGFYKYVNNIIYHWCRLKEPSSSNQRKRRSRTASSVVRLFFATLPTDCLIVHLRLKPLAWTHCTQF